MTAYYNEIDAYAAQWLRNLIQAGHIVAGEVDERSIVDVRPDDLHGFTQCHFFAGIGGWSLAARVAGWPDDRELWSGSCPCQPFSVAGKQAGQADERHLWPEQFRLISARRPNVWVGEQVAAAVGKHWLDGVHSDLESIGYASGAVVVPACAVDAPHRRDRAWIVADRNLSEPGQVERDLGEVRDLSEGERQPELGAAVSLRSGEGGRYDVADAGGGGQSPRSGQNSQGHGEPQLYVANSCGPLGNTIGAGLEGQRRHGNDGDQPRWQHPQPAGPVAEASSGNVGYTEGGVREERPGLGETPSECAARRSNRSVVADAYQSGEGEEREQRGGEFGGARSNSRGSAWVGAEWLAGADGKARRFEPGIRLLANGVPARVGKLRAYGNAIVPQVAAEIIGAYMDCRP